MRGRLHGHRAIPPTLRGHAAAPGGGDLRSECLRGVGMNRIGRRSQRAAILAALGRMAWTGRRVARLGIAAPAVRAATLTVLDRLEERPRRTDRSRSDDDRAAKVAAPPLGTTKCAACSGWRRAATRRLALRALVGAYAGDTYRLLADLAGLLGASLAYVDRLTVEAHLERDLSEREWAAVAGELPPMAFDERIGEAGSLRTDWIDDVLTRAGVPGRGPTLPTRPATGSDPCCRP